MLEYLVLGLLEDGPLTGYDLKKRIENGPGVFFKVSFGALYPLLDRLCKKGEATVECVAEGGRTKKYYTVTPQGQNRFNTWLCQPVDVHEADNQRLAKIYFFDCLPNNIRELRLAEYKQATSEYIAALEARREQLLACTDPARHYFKLSTLYYGIIVLRETLRWCEYLSAGLPLETLLPKNTKEV